MANSIEIKIGADAADFNKELRKLDREIRGTERTAKELDKSLDLEFDTKRAEQAQKQFQKALELTEQKAEAIRQQLKHLEDSGKIDTAQYQKLQTELIKAETKAVTLKDKLEQVKKVEIEQLAKKFTDTGDKIEKAGQKLAVFSAAAAGAIAGAVKLAKDAVEVGDEIMTLSDKYDMSTEAIQRWQYVAMQTDVESEQLFKSMQKIQSAFGEQAAGGTNAAVKALEALGLSYQNFDTNEEAFQATIAALSELEDRNLQVAYATDILGDRFAASLILMLQSKDAIGDYIAEFEEVGYLSDETIGHLADLDNEVNKVTAQFELAKTQLGVAMIPIYETLVKLLEEKVIPAIEKLSDWFSNLDPSTQKAIMGLLGVIAVAAPLLILIGKISTGIGGLIKLFGNMNKQALITAAGVGALGAALALGLNLIADWKNMSTIEKILKSLAMAALIAAGAVAVFHASWSLGIAIGAITAGIVAAVAAVKAAEKDITGGTEAADYVGSASSGITSNAPSEQDLADIGSWTKTIPQGGSSSTIINSSEDNSSNTYNIYIDSNEYVSAEEIADIVSKRIATLSQSRG